MNIHAIFSTVLLIQTSAGLWCTNVRADCADTVGLEQMASAVRPAIVKLQTDGIGEGCHGYGTGFFITHTGHVLTAGHVIPRNCQNLQILGLADGTTSFKLHLVGRSELDIALLQIDEPRRTPILKIVKPVNQPLDFELKRVTIASFYPEYPRPSFTTARIDSTEIIGEQYKWGLCATAANKGRSGSPVIMDDGSVVAVFVERPRGEIQDVARIIPLAFVPDMEILSIETSASIVEFGSGLDPAIQVVVGGDPVLYEYTVSATTSTHQSPFDSHDRFLVTAAGVEPASSMSSIELALHVANGAKIRYAERHESVFEAFPGFRFDPDMFEIKVESHNPPSAPLPNRACAIPSDDDCYSFSADGKRLSVKYTLYAGPVLDQARGWLGGSIVTKQIPVSK